MRLNRAPRGPSQSTGEYDPVAFTLSSKRRLAADGHHLRWNAAAGHQANPNVVNPARLNRVFNTAIFLDDRGEIRGTYQKMQFDEGYHPSWWFNRLGERSRAFDTPLGRCGILICNDRWNPALARIPALDGAQFLVIPAYGSTSRAQDEAVVSRARETSLPIVEANVGVTLVVSGGTIAAVDRTPQSVTFAEIEIPFAIPARPAERDAVEREFLAWRETEMRNRYEKKRHQLTAEEVTTAAR